MDELNTIDSALAETRVRLGSVPVGRKPPELASVSGGNRS